MSDTLFLSYSRRDAAEAALRLADQLTQGPPSFKVWVDRRQLQAGNAWDEQLVEALRSCSALLYLMTVDSVHVSSGCKHEWTRALKYKKPIIPLLFTREAELPYRLEPREYIDFTADYDAALARLREHLRWRATPEGQLHALREQLDDARRDLDHAKPADRDRLHDDVRRLEDMLESQRRSVEHPEEAARRADESIQRGVERARQPEQPLTPAHTTRFINRPPAVAPSHFQDRHSETRLLGDFLQDPSLRLMTVVGRGGVGKTALVCRLLKALEGGRLPDDAGPLGVDGIVYLSAAGGRAINFPNLCADLGRLLPEETAQRLQALQRQTDVSIKDRALALLDAFPSGRTLVLLDNFEDLVDRETLAIRDAELNAALRGVLSSPPHGVKLILTTRVRPSELLRLRPALQRVLDLDEGLASPFAENILRAMDPAGKLRLRDAPMDLLTLTRERTRGYPRALEAIVGILADDTGTTLAELLEDLAGFLPNVADVVEALVGEAFNRLDAAAEQVMQALAIYGAPVPPVAIDYLLQPHRAGIDSAPVLRRLVNQQFARRDANHYHIHPVDRQYALSRITADGPADAAAGGRPFSRSSLYARAADYFKETRKPRETWKCLDDLAPQLREFELRCAAAEHDAAAAVLLEISSEYLEQWGNYPLLAELHEQLVGKVDDAALEQANLTRLGNAYWRIGRLEEALHHHHTALAMARDRADRASEAALLTALGADHSSLGELERAVDLYLQSLAIAEAIGVKNSQAHVLGELANAYSDLGRTAEALEHYERGLDLDRELGNRNSECEDLRNLGALYGNLGEFAEARKHSLAAREIAREAGYRLMEVSADWTLAELLRLEGRTSEALLEHQRLVVAADGLGVVQLQSSLRIDLARCHLALHDSTAAHALIDEAARFRYPLTHHRLLGLRGIVTCLQADRRGAARAFRDALEMAAEIPSHVARSYEASFFRGLSLAGLALSEDASLVSAASEAYRHARTITAAPGIIQVALWDLDLLVPADPNGLLRPVRAVLKNPR